MVDRIPKTALVLVAIFAIGCSHNIGDSCTSNADCSPIGNRFCDKSAPGGYCTLEGCDVNVCPSESACIRFFTLLPDRPCTFVKDHPNGRSDCAANERCLRDDPVSGSETESIPAHCAPESSERRWCQLRCQSDRDCRPGYQCRATETMGAESVPTLDMSLGSSVKFCAPRG